MGYAGGTTPNPTYHSIGDHSESIQIDYDPSIITYRQLLDIFWATHNPCARSYSRQYMSAIFYSTEEQKRLALETKKQQEAKGTIHTEIAPLTEFTQAEDYHQKYYLRSNGALMKELKAVYSSDDEFVRSTAAARLNAYVVGEGSYDNLKSELSKLDLPKERLQRILELTRR